MRFKQVLQRYFLYLRDVIGTASYNILIALTQKSRQKPFFEQKRRKIKMALNKKDQKIDSSPKSTLQGQGKNTKYSKTSRNSARKKYRGQGR